MTPPALEPPVLKSPIPLTAAESGVRPWLRFYGWLFAGTGAVFVLLPGTLMSVINIAAALPGTSPLEGSQHTLWLGLTGSMMAMISFLAFSLSRDSSRSVAWDCLLLSKGMSTAFFLAFAAADRNLIFIGAALVDGSLFAHLIALRGRAAGPQSQTSWTPRLTGSNDCLYEVWFMKFNDPKTRNALWLRYTIDAASPRPTGSCWYALFDAERGETRQGRWDESLEPLEPSQGAILCRFQRSILTRNHARAENEGVSWDFSWRTTAVPVFDFIPETLYRLGVAGTVYQTPMPHGIFEGEFTIDGRRYRFQDASGSIGHLWGRKMGDNWRWAHAVLEDAAGQETVFEILSAQAGLGPFKTPRITTAHLWFQGKHYRSTGVLRGLNNGTRASGPGWSFTAEFDGLSVAGECLPSPSATVDFIYEDTDGRKIRCSNSKTGEMRLRLIAPDGSVFARLKTKDTAAIESAETAR